MNHHHFKNEEAIRVSVEFNILEKKGKSNIIQIYNFYSELKYSSQRELDLD